MRIKTPKLVQFIEGLHEFISAYPEFRKTADVRSNVELKRIVQALMLAYLENFFREAGYKNVSERAIAALYWDQQVSEYIGDHVPIFGERKNPDFIIADPYLIAIDFKQGNSGSTLEEGIGRSIIYTLSGKFDFVYCLFRDQSEDRKIERAVDYKLESSIIAEIWERYNVSLKFV